jgi:hypothetical protein
MTLELMSQCKVSDAMRNMWEVIGPHRRLGDGRVEPRDNHTFPVYQLNVILAV